MWTSNAVPCPPRGDADRDYLTAEITVVNGNPVTWRVDYHESIIDPPYEGQRGGEAPDLARARAAAAAAIRELLALG